MESVKFHAFHGVFNQEQLVGNEFEVSVSIEIPISSGMENDDLEGTVSYADVYAVCKVEMDSSSKLLEHVALRISNHLLERWPQIIRGKIKIVKLHPPVAGFMGKAAVSYSF